MKEQENTMNNGEGSCDESEDNTQPADQQRAELRLSDERQSHIDPRTHNAKSEEQERTDNMYCEHGRYVTHLCAHSNNRCFCNVTNRCKNLIN